jgi:WD40 repeat protein
VNGGRIGAIGDARVIPHPVTWSPTQAVLVVETRNGAIYWDVITGTQTTLTTDWDGWRARNLTEITWETEQLQIRTVTGENLTFGQTEGESAATPFPIVTEPCLIRSISRNYYALNISHRFYDRATGQLRYGELVLETALDTPDLEIFGTFANCRYLIMAIQRVGSPTVYDTVIYDLSTGARAGVFEDGRSIPHRFMIDPRGEYLIIETRHGGYLWHVPSDTKTRLVDGFQVVNQHFHQPFVQNFYQIHWDTERGQILTVSVKNPFGVTVFDYNGQEVGYYLTQSTHPIGFKLLNDGRWLVGYTTQAGASVKISLFDRVNGITQHLNPAMRVSDYEYLISPGGRYFLLITSEAQFHVWDLQQLNADGRANVVNFAQNYRPFYYWIGLSPTQFIAEHIIQRNERQWDILTGQLIFVPREYAPVSTEPIAQASGYSVSDECYNQNHTRIIQHTGEQLVVRDQRTAEILHVLLENDKNRAEFGEWVGNCRYIVVTIYAVPVRWRHGPLETQLWDATTYTHLPIPFADLDFLSWSPDGDRALISVPQGPRQATLHLWTIATNTFTSLNFTGQLNSPYYFINPRSVYWDYARGQVLLFYGYNVYVFDLQTGAQRHYFEGGTAFLVNANFRGPEMFVVGNWVFIRGNEIVSFYHLDTLQNDQVWVGVRPLRQNSIGISPDGRYLAIAAPRYLYVWDLTTLPAGVRDRDPRVYNHGLYHWRITLRFIDSETLELQSPDTTRRYQISTGQVIE